jgi:membrane protease YdiL (CAAX protease family)
MVAVPPFTARAFAAMTNVPTVGQTLILIIIVLFALLIVGHYADGWSVVLSLVVTQGIFLVPTVLLLLRGGYSFRQSLALKMPRPAVWPATLLIVGGGWLVGLVLASLSDLIVPFPEDFLKRFDELFRGLNELPVVVGLGLMAIVPGVCEELVCRGFVLHSFLPRINRIAAAALTALIFGMLHLDPFRLVPTMFLGFLFGLIVVWSGSIFPAMLAHACNNAFSYLMQRNQESLAAISWLNPDSVGLLPWWLIAAGVLMMAAGLWWLKKCGQPSEKSVPSPEVVSIYSPDE